MENRRTEEEDAWAMLALSDEAEIRSAQRLAAIDPDFRNALADTWHIACRRTLYAQRAEVYVPIVNPFTYESMARYRDEIRRLGDADSPF